MKKQSLLDKVVHSGKLAYQERLASPEIPLDSPTEKHRRVAGTVAKVKAFSRGRSCSPPSPTAPPQPANGWCSTGFLPGKTYRVEDLVAVWRGAFVRFRGNAEMPGYAYYIRPYLLTWLQEQGHTRVEAIVEYAVMNWNALRTRYSINSDEPALNVIYGFRKFFGELMEKADKKTWGAHFPTSERGHGNEPAEEIEFF